VADNPASTGARLGKIVTDFWQLATAIVGIVAAVGAGRAYFATRQQVIQVQCTAQQNLLLTTLPSQIDQVITEIRVAEAELRNLKEGTLPATQKQEEIDELKARKKDLNDQYKGVVEKVQQNVCFSEVGNDNAKKKP